jgi:hypothetical protein
MNGMWNLNVGIEFRGRLPRNCRVTYTVIFIHLLSQNRGNSSKIHGIFWKDYEHGYEENVRIIKKGDML